MWKYIDNTDTLMVERSFDIGPSFLENFFGTAIKGELIFPDISIKYSVHKDYRNLV
jgi:hypothetical protein